MRSTVLACVYVAVPLCVLVPPGLGAGELRFRAEELPTRLTVGYAVLVLDLNGDAKRDIAVVDSKRFVWLENPSWREHVIHADAAAANDNVCFAPIDLDRDGRVEFAVGRDWQFGNTSSGGAIGWLRRGALPQEPWTYHAIAEEPTTHRMRAADIDGDGRVELVVVPLKGRATTPPHFAERGVRVLAYRIPDDPLKGPWTPEVIDETTHVTHNFAVADLDRNGKTDIVLASFEGLSVLETSGDGTWKRTRIGAGDQESSPNRGASEVCLGRLRNGGSYLATIEPWHGDKVVVYLPPHEARPAAGDWLWKRQVLDAKLRWGHAVASADLDGDGEDELIAGVRDDLDGEHRRGVRIYDPEDAGGAAWKHTVLDPGGVAVEDLAAADINGDGKVDIVAVGRQTHNVKVYWNETPAPAATQPRKETP